MADDKAGPGTPTVEVIERQRGFDGFFKLDRYHLRHRLYNGQMSPLLTRELFERGEAAAVLPYDPGRDRVVLLEQFRIGAIRGDTPWLREIVAGIVEPHETPEQVARREASEEAGAEILRLEPITTYYVSPGGTSEMIHLFCGQVDSAGLGGVHGLAEEVEDILVYSTPFDEAFMMVQDGRIDSAAPIIAIQWLALNRERLRREWRG